MSMQHMHAYIANICEYIEIDVDGFISFHPYARRCGHNLKLIRLSESIARQEARGQMLKALALLYKLVESLGRQ